MARVAGLLLAAGAGRRFGGPKALATFRGELLVERGVRVLRDAGCDPVAVVLGAEAGAVLARARLGSARVVPNPLWEGGIASSLAAGLRSLTGAAAAVVALVDQPLVTAAVVERLVTSWHGEDAAVATYDGWPGNPVLLAARVWGEVLDHASGDAGARGWLRAHPERVVRVACDGLGRPDDIDTPEDLARLDG